MFKSEFNDGQGYPALFLKKCDKLYVSLFEKPLFYNSLFSLPK